MRAIPKPKPKEDNGTGWIVTFADLMSLLLTFFILLLSFSKMDLEKYQVMAVALTSSFGASALTGQNKAGGNIIFADKPVVPPPPEKKEKQSELEKEFEDFGESDIELLEEPKEEPEKPAQIDPSIDKLLLMLWRQKFFQMLYLLVMTPIKWLFVFQKPNHFLLVVKS